MPNYNSSNEMFHVPKVYDNKPARKLCSYTIEKDDKGNTVRVLKSVEDVSNDLIPSDFEDMKISSLISAGIDPKPINIIDTSGIGVTETLTDVADFVGDNQNLIFDKHEK